MLKGYEKEYVTYFKRDELRRIFVKKFNELEHSVIIISESGYFTLIKGDRKKIIMRKW